MTSALQYTHYGSQSVTINHGHGALDTRTRVGHMNRNIKIVAGSDVGWGYSVIVYVYYNDNTLLVGNAVLKGVQFVNGGQYDTLNSPLKFYNLRNGNYSSIVT